MALIPLIITDEELDSVIETIADDEVTPSKTYRLDLNTGDVYAEFIDHEEAVHQAVVKLVKTARDRYIIYTSDYGCEIRDVLGRVYSKEYLDMEIPRLINEAVLVDDRVEETTDYEIIIEGDELSISFKVLTTTGDTIEIEMEVEI